MAGFAALGGKGAYIGKVRDDQFGTVFRHDMKAIGVDFDTPAAQDGPSTGRCLVMVSDDAQRTMATYLGAATDLMPDDVDAGVIEASKVVYLEGYLFDRDHAKQAFIKAADIAHAKGGKVSLSLSDSFCVGRHREAFLALVEEHIDILFANEEEITALYQVDHFDEAMKKVRGHCEVACLTRGQHGAVILSGDEVHIIDAMKVDPVVDTTGAGDQFAAGFLFGYTQGFDLATAGRYGVAMASEIIGHYGARPDADVKDFTQNALKII
jgi:sugar/nucleoside kinase (ribokinase family)